MNVNTYTRAKVRKDGSISIPKAIRISNSIKGGDIVEYAVSGSEITIRTTKRICPVCGLSMHSCVHFGPVDICDSCNKIVLAYVRKGNDIAAGMAYAASKSKRLGGK